MFKKLSTNSLPNYLQYIVLVGEAQSRQIVQSVRYIGTIYQQSILYYSFQQNDYGVWSMTQQQMSDYKLYWIPKSQLIERVLESDLEG